MTASDLIELEASLQRIPCDDWLKCAWIMEGKSQVDRWIMELMDLQESAIRSELTAAVFPGRRVRPSLMLQLAGPSAEVSTEALILELFHASSIVVDDILDGDDGRREIANSLYRVGANAVLVSHLLASLAWDLASRRNRITDVRHAYRDMCSGEFADVFVFDRSHTWLDLYQHRVLAKTESLFALAFVWGLESQPEVPTSCARHLGSRLGALFQMSNDVFDTTAVSRSQRNRRNYKYPLSVTLPLVCLLDSRRPLPLRDQLLQARYRPFLSTEEIEALDVIIVEEGFLFQAEEIFRKAISCFIKDMACIDVNLTWLAPFLRELEDYSIWTKDYELLRTTPQDHS